MKKLLAALFLSALCFTATPARAGGLTVCLVNCPGKALVAKAPLKADPSEAQILPTLYLSPSVGFDAFVRDNSTNEWKAGVIPGVGYGIKYRPSSWTLTENVVALDIFMQAALTDQTFNIDALPVVTLFDWVGIGFGYRWKLATESGVGDRGGTLFSIGIRKSIASF